MRLPQDDQQLVLFNSCLYQNSSTNTAGKCEEWKQNGICCGILFVSIRLISFCMSGEGGGLGIMPIIDTPPLTVKGNTLRIKLMAWMVALDGESDANSATSFDLGHRPASATSHSSASKALRPPSVRAIAVNCTRASRHLVRVSSSKPELIPQMVSTSSTTLC